MYRLYEVSGMLFWTAQSGAQDLFARVIQPISDIGHGVHGRIASQLFTFRAADTKY